MAGNARLEQRLTVDRIAVDEHRDERSLPTSPFALLRSWRLSWQRC